MDKKEDWLDFVGSQAVPGSWFLLLENVGFHQRGFMLSLAGLKII